MKNSESRLQYQPKYKIGQCVKVKIKTEDKATGFEFFNEIVGIISVIQASATSQEDTYEYGVTTDLPSYYHRGKIPFTYIYEEDIVLAS